MKEFLLLLFFGRSMLLMPGPVTINASCINVNLEKPARVINAGAALEINVPAGSNGSPPVTNPVTSPDVLARLYPFGTVTATLYKKDRTSVDASNVAVGTTNDSYILILRPQKLFHVGDKFYDIKICSKGIISSVEIHWQTAME